MRPAASTPKSSLLPREHGAYAQLAFPLLTALALGRLRLAPVLLAGAIVALFLAHEPLMVLSGGRGGRAQREAGPRARRRAAALLAGAALTGTPALLLTTTAVRISALLPLALAVSVAALSVTRRVKTLVGELMVAVTLASTLIPVALAGGAGLREALIAFAVWAVVFALGTVTVRAIIARAKSGARPGRVVHAAPLLCAAAIVAALAVVFNTNLPAPAAVAIMPTALVALIFGVLGVHPRNLRRIGWSLVISNTLVLAALLAGFG